MHRLSASFVLGYHGCTDAVAERLLSGAAFEKSENNFDWLGSGIYFWEANPRRGMEFAAEQMHRRNESGHPTVVGAVIDLSFCLDLTTTAGIQQIQRGHKSLVSAATTAKTALPANDGGTDRLRRHLDCAVINTVHKLREDAGDQPFDTVKGIFTEGGPAYENAGFASKTHVQICVRNRDCIKGVFRVPDDQLKG